MCYKSWNRLNFVTRFNFACLYRWQALGTLHFDSLFLIRRRIKNPIIIIIIRVNIHWTRHAKNEQICYNIGTIMLMAIIIILIKMHANFELLANRSISGRPFRWKLFHFIYIFYVKKRPVIEEAINDLDGAYHECCVVSCKTIFVAMFWTEPNRTEQAQWLAIAMYGLVYFVRCSILIKTCKSCANVVADRHLNPYENPTVRKLKGHM